MQNWAKSVEAEIANTEENQQSNVVDLRNAYQVNPATEYNPGTSAQHPERVKMYAELTRKYSVKQLKYFREDLWKNYRIREKDYAKIFDDQQGDCACCTTNQVFLTRRLSVDHNHKTGKVRALLCDNCNPAVGFVKESPARCYQLAEYLEKHKN